jgi:hypothetical protein
VKNVGVIIFTLANKMNMLISGSKFINNNAPIVIVLVTDSNKLVIKIIGYDILIKNNESIIQTLDSVSSLI